jgi:RecB family exonuclease
VNPPYSQPGIALFTDKLVAEVKSGRVTAAIALTHNYTDTQWFRALASARPFLAGYPEKASQPVIPARIFNQ